MNSEISFNKCFEEVNRTKKRYRVLIGSAGSGKSMNIARDYILKMSDMRYKGANLLCVRKSEVSNANSTFSELLKAIIDIFGSKYEQFWEVRNSPMSMRCRITGNQIVFRGCNDVKQIEKIKSITFSTGQLTWIWIEEANEITQNDCEILDDRLRGEFKNPNLYYQITLTLNPVSASCWIKRVFWDISSPDVLCHRSTYLQNKFIGPEYAARMERRKELDPEGYRIYGLGEWGETDGLILTNYKVMELDLDKSCYDDVAYGQDFGYNHANAILDLGINEGDVYIKRECYIHEKDTSEIIPMIADWDKVPPMFCDCANPDKIKMWQTAGFNAIPCEKGRTDSSVFAQIDWLKQRKIYIDPSCTNTIAEIEQWRWKKDTKTGLYTDEPVPFFDDAMAALRYGVQDWRLRDIVQAKAADRRTEVEKYRDKVLNKHRKRRKIY